MVWRIQRKNHFTASCKQGSIMDQCRRKSEKPCYFRWEPPMTNFNKLSSTVHGIYGWVYMAYRPIAKRWLCKHQPLLGNDRKQQQTCHDTWCVQPLLRSAQSTKRARWRHTTIENVLKVVFFINSLRACMTRQPTLCSTSKWSAVHGSSVGCSTAGNGSGIITNAKIRYQETSSEDITEKYPMWRAVTT
jgi:hypothetical protein